MCLTIFWYEKILQCSSKPILFYRLNNNISAMQHKLQHDTGVAMDNNAAQYWWYSTMLATNPIENPGRLAKTINADSFVGES